MPGFYIQSCINESNSIRRDVLSMGHWFETNKYLSGFGFMPPLPVGIAGSLQALQPNLVGPRRSY